MDSRIHGKVGDGGIQMNAERRIERIEKGTSEFKPVSDINLLALLVVVDKYKGEEFYDDIASAICELIARRKADGTWKIDEREVKE